MSILFNLLSIPAIIVIPPFLAEVQMTADLVFHVENKCNCFCYEKMQFLFCITFNHILSHSVQATNKNLPLFLTTKLRYQQRQQASHRLKTSQVVQKK
jgi:hypothetical protein